MLQTGVSGQQPKEKALLANSVLIFRKQSRENVLRSVETESLLLGHFNQRAWFPLMLADNWENWVQPCSAFCSWLHRLNSVVHCQSVFWSAISSRDLRKRLGHSVSGCFSLSPFALIDVKMSFHTYLIAKRYRRSGNKEYFQVATVF